ncbi:isocitrate lyase/PEP mutase family protein [Denitrobaculum tricleocarpae]|uniref:2-methylisocitrate lyase n=1 Tax=Denitrobaculum tricleocarpae TaxID=2591009 RepID=A0A545TG15_9PROT|nr:isocitrate lyase/phosphoenolpyruvate mutase family protein [Denitrobaculum tricleocarpae]TQV76170.1 carboxyvinyl-carboxyphosphonate phosphorylmutase [Denitrobaculum tricleocarpae]
MTPQKRLRQQLAGDGIVVAPGVYDAFGAMMAERAGFETLYLSGASISYTQLGSPDIGLTGMDEVAGVVGRIRERVDLPIVVDGDAGFGNALNVQRTVRVFERSGASAIQLEDQQLPKRCGHLDGKKLVSVGEMSGKIKAATDSRTDSDTVIIARTDAVTVEGLDAALERSEAYVEAGADMLFVEAVKTEEDMRRVIEQFAGRLPIMANMVEGGKTPVMPAAQLAGIGFKLVIFPGGLVRAIAKTMSAYFEALHREGTTASFKENMLDFTQLNDLLGTQAILDGSKKYED